MRTLLTTVAAAALLAMLACGSGGGTSDGVGGGDGEAEVEVIKELPPTPYGGRGRASLDEMVATSPLIVRATLDSVRTVGVETTFSNYLPALEYTLNVVEYLKGSGDTTLKAVAVSSWLSYETEAIAEGKVSWLLKRRDKRWDERQAIVFLRRHPGGAEYIVNNAQTWWLGAVDELGSDHTFTVASAEARTWLPDASATPPSPGTARSVQELRFLLEDPGQSAVSGRSTANAATVPTITLRSLKTKITNMESAISASSDPEAYRKCLATDLATKRKNALKEEPTHEERATSIGSGQPAGTEVWTVFWASELVGTTPPSGDNFGEGKTWWFEGPDAAVLGLKSVHPGKVVTGRPLPAGEYRAFMRTRGPEGVVCDAPALVMESWEHIIIVTAPEGTLAEAFFDPVADGAATTATTTVGTITYESDEVEADLTPSVTNQHLLDFIALDGSVSLSLDVSDATEADGVLSWTVASSPWSAGDKLMLRIRQPRPSVTVTLSPREEQVSSIFTFTYTDILMEWTDPDACDSRYLVGLYEGETLRRYFGFHPAPETTSLNREMGYAWDTISSYDWNARVTCAPADGSEWRVVAETPMLSGLPASGS